MRRATRMEEYYKRMRIFSLEQQKTDKTPYTPGLHGEFVYVMDSLNPVGKIQAEICRTKTKNGRHIVSSLYCPECMSPMEWDKNWEAFICTQHGKRAIYELT
jgi:hypothetical protein